MAFVTADRVKETTSTSGTGTYTLAGAVTGFQSFAAIGNGNTCYYGITDGTDWEVGLGTYTSAGTTLARTTILASSNGGSAVNWAAVSKQIWVDAPALVFGYLGGGTTGFAANNVLLGNGTGVFQVVAPGTSGNLLTSNGSTWQSTAPAATGFTLSSAASTTSGSDVAITGIPSTTKMIVVQLNGVSTNGSGIVQIQIGSGSVTTSGYTSGQGGVFSSTAAGNGATSGFSLDTTGGAAINIQGAVTLTLEKSSSNTWVAQGVVVFYNSTTYSSTRMVSGKVSLGGAIDRVNLNTANTFDAGEFSVLYQ